MGGSKKNHVIQRALQSYADPPSSEELICQACGSRGGNKVDVMLPDGYQALVILPAKFRKQIWIRKGSFVIVQVIQDEVDEKGDRIFNGEIVRVLLKDDEKHLRALEGGKFWPERWCMVGADDERVGGSDYDDGNSDDGDDGGSKCEDESRKDAGKDSLSSDPTFSSSEDELPEHLQRVSNRRRVQYRDDDSSSDD